MDEINTLANVAIVIGYVLVPFLWLPHLPLTRPVLISGTVFFLTCAITHLALALHADHGGRWLLLNHILQAGAVLAFVLGFGRMLRRANLIRNTPGGKR